MELTSLPYIDFHETASDHSFVFDAHNQDDRHLITRYRGTSVVQNESGRTLTGWQKSIYHFGGLNREVPVVVSVELDQTGKIQNIFIDEQSSGSQGTRCDFKYLEELCREKVCGTDIMELSRSVTCSQDVECLHVFEILSACSSFCSYLASCGLQEGIEHEYTEIRPDNGGLTAESTREINDKKDHMRIRLGHRTWPDIDEHGLPVFLDSIARVYHNDEFVLEDRLYNRLYIVDSEAVYAELNQLISKCHQLEKSYFGIEDHAEFFNTPSMVRLFILSISHSCLKGKTSRTQKMEQILHYLQTSSGQEPCKGFVE